MCDIDGLWIMLSEEFIVIRSLKLLVFTAIGNTILLGMIYSFKSFETPVSVTSVIIICSKYLISIAPDKHNASSN